MSITLDNIDLSQFTVLKSGTIDLNPARSKEPYDPTQVDKPAHLRIYNESGSLLKISSDSGTISDYIPAGAWPVYTLDDGTSKINFTVISILPNPPIQQLLPTYFNHGEEVPASPTLGNSPIGIGGTISTTSVQTLSNENNPQTPAVLVIDIGTTTHQQLITIFHDGSFSWNINVGGVNHTLMQGSLANLLQLGMLGDVVNALGSFQVAQNLGVSGAATLSGAGTGLTVSNTSQFNGQINHLCGDIETNGMVLGSNKRLYWENKADSLRQTHTFTGTGTGTYSHGCVSAPFWVGPICTATNSSTSQGYDTVTSTQVHVTLFNSVSFSALCLVG